MMRSVRFIALLTVGLGATAGAFDVSWIPADDGPLPLSASWREKMRNLCTLIESGKPLPTELTERRTSLDRICARLAEGDENVAAAQGGLAGSAHGLPVTCADVLSETHSNLNTNRRHRFAASQVVAALVAGVAALAIWGMQGSGAPRAPPPATADQVTAAREARLRRFATGDGDGDGEDDDNGAAGGGGSGSSPSKSPIVKRAMDEARQAQQKRTEELIAANAVAMRS